MKPIWKQPNTAIRWIRNKLLHHLVSFLLVTQITRLKKSSKGVIYEESLHRRSASTWLIHFLAILVENKEMFIIARLNTPSKNNYDWYLYQNIWVLEIQFCDWDITEICCWNVRFQLKPASMTDCQYMNLYYKWKHFEPKRPWFLQVNVDKDVQILYCL